MVEESEYEKFVEEVSENTDGIIVRKSLNRKRGGKARWRDLAVYLRQMWSYGRQWIIPLSTIVLMISLTPKMFKNINYFFDFLFNIKPFPVGWSSIIAIILGFLVLIMGAWGYKRGGVEKRRKEITEQQDPVYFMQWKRFNNLAEKLERIEKKLE